MYIRIYDCIYNSCQTKTNYIKYVISESHSNIHKRKGEASVQIRKNAYELWSNLHSTSNIGLILTRKSNDLNIWKKVEFSLGVPIILLFFCFLYFYCIVLLFLFFCSFSLFVFFFLMLCSPVLFFLFFLFRQFDQIQLILPQERKISLLSLEYLTHISPILHCKSIDWFLCVYSIGLIYVKKCPGCNIKNESI